MLNSIDHMVILVEDLDRAAADYTALGFIVTPGGTHAEGSTHNALVAFADGTYLELIAFTRAAPDHQWWRHVAAGEGLIDFALLPTAIEQDVAVARSRGLDLPAPQSGGRLRPDGQRVTWQTVRPATPDLPFLCGDLTPRELRVPQAEQRLHPNGVVGIAGVAVATADLPASAMRYAALLGGAAAGPAFRVGAATITLAAPAPGASQQDLLRAQLNQRGEGPFALTLRGASAATFDPACTHGVRLDVVVG